jgi:hypothetical protein
MSPAIGTTGDWSTGETSWQNLVLNATLGITTLTKATASVITVAGQGLTLAWRCWPGTRATAKGASEQGCALFVMEREKSLELLIEGRSGSDAQGRSEGNELRESARMDSQGSPRAR